MKTHMFTELEKAVNAESYEWLQDNYPDLARALESEVNRGATPKEIRRYIMEKTERAGIARRLEQAAAHLQAEKVAQK